MAYDFLGTFTEDDFNLLWTFAEAESESIDKRMRALAVHRARIESLTVKYQRAEAKLLDGTDDKLVSDLYKIDPDYARGDTKQEAAFKAQYALDSMTPEDLAAYNDAQNKMKDRGKIYSDLEPARAIAKVKDWLRPVIRMKRENIQYNLMKLRDQQERINKEIILMRNRKDELADLYIQVVNFIASPDFPGVKAGG